MLPVVVNFQVEEHWQQAMSLLAERLRASLGSRLKAIIALPSSAERMLESNVLIVVERRESRDLERVLEAVLEVERELKLEGEIAPMIASQSERDLIEAFLRGGGIRGGAWRRAVKLLAERLRASLGSRLKAIIALPSSAERMLESNVLIVVERRESRDLERVLEAVLEVERELKLEGEIAPMIASQSERDLIEAFEEEGFAC